mmetsp:Transcript_18704/g.42390  ORF Transcript_18704/g.42390 Transcript_18704/m.42390 type:complete len:114 (-) Transcript_18704:50-391(-)
MAASTRLFVRPFFHAVPYRMGGICICICPGAAIGPAETFACASRPESDSTPRNWGAFTGVGVNEIRRIVVMKNTPAAILTPLQLVRAMSPYCWGAADRTPALLLAGYQLNGDT